MRPGIKIPFGSPGFRNKPSVEPPALLKLVSVLAIVSIVGVLLFSVLLAVSDITSSDIGLEKSVYVAVLHFVLPFGIAYTVATNSSLSRPVIAVYLLLFCAAILLGVGFFGELPVPQSAKTALACLIAFVVGAWLFGSPKMRYYYAALSEAPIPPDLQSRANDLAGSNWPGPGTRAFVAWITDHLETVVLLGFTLAAFFSCVNL